MKQVIKDYREKRLVKYLDEIPNDAKVLIVFWHGLGDLLMFLPIYHALTHHCFNLHFDLCVQPGVGHKDVAPYAIEVWEDKFLDGYDMAFVINFPMSEGSAITKAEKCLRDEIGLETLDITPFRDFLSGSNIRDCRNTLVGVHLQGTCLPGSTNPDPALAHQIWQDIIDAGYVPFDLHFLHVFHNPANAPFPFAARNCRDLKPNILTLANLIASCGAFVGVASGPFVLALTMNPDKTIYLQKHHKADCYVKDFKNVVDLLNYRKEDLQALLKGILG